MGSVGDRNEASALSVLLGGVAAVVLGALAVASLLVLAPPEPRPASSPAKQFSAERAFAHVQRVARRPHPVGSAANAEVRRYLVHQLEEMGLRPDVRRATVRWVSPARGAAVARVHNIHARIPGSASTGSTGHVVLVAHYDSVVGGPGAADDASGVAAVLEIARALMAGPAPRNDIDIVLTDGEEQGLLGARAFVDAGVLDPRRSVVLNLEARGTCGPSNMFQTGAENAHVVPAVARGGHPFASSLSNAVYQVLPNDTDFTEFREAGYTGLNFAFVGCSANYHTPRDSPANLSRSSLQHQGASVLAAARYFAAADVPALHGGGKLSYFTVLGQLVRYPQWFTLPIAILASAALVLTLLYARRRGERLRGVALAAATFPAPLLVVVGVAVATGKILGLLRPGYGFLAVAYHAGWYSAGMAALALAATAGWGLLLRRRTTAAETALAVWAWLAVLALVAAVLLPGGAYLFTWPVIVGCLALVVVLRLRAGPPWRAFACCAAAVPAIAVMLPVTRLLRQTFPVAFYPLVLMMVLLAVALPVLYLLAPVRRAFLVPAVAAVAGLALLTVVGVATPDPRHPRQVSLMYALDADRGRARWLSADREPAPWVDRYVAARPTDIGARLPRYAGKRFHAGRAPVAGVAPADVTVLASSREGDTRTVRLRLTGGGASRVTVYADTTGHQVVGARVDGVAVGGADTRPPAAASWGWGFRFFGVPKQGIEIVLKVRGDGPLPLRAVTHRTGLPRVPELTPRPDRLGWSGYAANRTLVATTFRV